MQDVDLVEQSWNKKRVVIGIILLVALSIAGAKVFAPQYFTKSQSESVAGVSTENTEEPSLSFPSASSIQRGTQEKIDEIRQQVSSLKVEDIASSSPQIQKIINDFKNLENYPKSQAKELCENICKNF